MSPPPLGFALVGTGMIAGYHAQAIAQTPGAQLVGVVSRSPDKGRAFAAKHNISVLTSTVEEMVARSDVHVITVTTPSGGHLEPALTAIRAGQARRRRETARNHPRARRPDHDGRGPSRREGRRHFFRGRFGSGAQTVKAAVDAGRLGRLVLASAYIKWAPHVAEYYQTPVEEAPGSSTAGGALMNQAIHGVDLLQWFAGLPTEVFGQLTRRVHTGIQADDTTVATLKYPDGALGTIEATTAAWPGWSRRIELCGEKGSICLEDDHIARWDFVQNEPGDDAIRSAPRDNALGSGAGVPGGISLAGHLRPNRRSRRRRPRKTARRPSMVAKAARPWRSSTRSTSPPGRIDR
ncbi:MAG: Gfo/Idh/MocA family oxidoreductase [Lacunisphaera sp.]